jgi:hypothetical protein
MPENHIAQLQEWISRESLGNPKTTSELLESNKLIIWMRNKYETSRKKPDYRFRFR